jgi:hypothetical protein
MSATTNPQQVAVLLQSLLAKGLSTQDALPTIKCLVQAKIFSLDDLSESNMPQEISSKLQSKLLSAARGGGGQKNRARNGSSSSSSFPPNNKRRKTTIQTPIVIPAVTSQPMKIMINRAPVLTLWVAIVSQTVFSLSLEEALTIGSAYAAITAKAKGTSLGIYSSTTEAVVKNEDQKVSPPPVNDDDTDSRTSFVLMNQLIRARVTPDGIRALVPRRGGGGGANFNDNDDDNNNDLEGLVEVDPHATWKHLQKKFPDGSLPYIIQLMQEASRAAGDTLESTAYQYYMHIRPSIPSGTKGWGAHGHLHTTNLQDFYPLLTVAPPSQQQQQQPLSPPSSSSSLLYK